MITDPVQIRLLGEKKREESLRFRRFMKSRDHSDRMLRRIAAAGCVSLDGSTCTVYDARPDACQRFPHLVRGAGSIASRMWQMVDRAC